MTPESISLVKKSWTRISLDYVATAELFYGKLFDLDPSLKPLFKTNDMRAQGQKLMTTLNTVVIALDKLDAIIPAIKKMGERHVDYGVKDEHYDTVGEALVWALDASIKDDFTEATKAAWIDAYTLVADTMKAAAAEIAA